MHFSFIGVAPRDRRRERDLEYLANFHGRSAKEKRARQKQFRHPRSNRPPTSPKCRGQVVAIALAAALVFLAAQSARAELLNFQIVQFDQNGQALSHASFIQRIDLSELGAGVHTTVPQYPDPDKVVIPNPLPGGEPIVVSDGPITGSDITSLIGNLHVDLTPTTIELVPGGQVFWAINNTPGNPNGTGPPGSYSPDDPYPGPEPNPWNPPGGTQENSQYGVKIDAPVFLYEVVHQLQGDWSTTAPGPRLLTPVTGTFAYSAGNDFLINSAGRIAFTSVLGSDTTSVDGEASVLFGTSGNMLPSWNPLDTTAGPDGTLTLPIESEFTVTLDTGDISPGTHVYVTFFSYGQILATPIGPVPEPSSVVLFALGSVALAAFGWRLRQRRGSKVAT